jgi:hypothetical protein
MLEGVECGNPDRVVKLAGEQIRDDGFEVGLFDLCLAIHGGGAETVNDQIYRYIGAVRARYAATN